MATTRETGIPRYVSTLFATPLTPPQMILFSKIKVFTAKAIQAFSFFQNSPRPTSVTAINEVELIACQLEDFDPYLMESKELTMSLLQILASTCDYLSRKLHNTFRYNRYQKVAAFLLEMAGEDNAEKGITDGILPYSHEEISTFVGLSRVTTTKVLNEFQKEGYIELEYRKVRLLNKKALSHVLEQC